MESQFHILKRRSMRFEEPVEPISRTQLARQNVRALSISKILLTN